jgi:hypothetical protein
MKTSPRSKKAINSNTGHTFTRLYVGFDSLDTMTEHDLVPRKKPEPQYTPAQRKLMASVGTATIPVKISIERAKMFK